MTKRIVIADDDRDLTRVLAQRCRRLGLQVETAADGFEAGFDIFLTWDNRDTPDLIILDVNMPVDDGLSICEELLREPSLALVPVIILTGRSDKATIRRCEELGAYYVFKAGDVWGQLKPIVCELLDIRPDADMGEKPAERKARATKPARITPPVSAPSESHRILWIDDDRDLLEAMKIRLEAHGFAVIPAYTGLQGFLTAIKERPDLIISDYVMPDGYGSYVVRRLKEHYVTSGIPVIVVTGRDVLFRVSDHKDPAMERQFQRIGAECLLSKPIDFDLLLGELRSRLRNPAELRDAMAMAPVGVDGN